MMIDPLMAVGVGRPFLYAFSSYGYEGVDKALQILHVSDRFHSWKVFFFLSRVFDRMNSR